jgi:putative transposase
VQSALSCSGRAVCRWLGINRSTLRYRPKPKPDRKRLLESEIVRLSREHPTLGYKKIAGKLRSLGYLANKKLVQRVRREEGLRVPPRRPRRRRQGLSTGLPQKALRRNHVWAWDFVSDYTQRGGKLRAFNLIDEYTRQCHCIHADRAIKASDVLALLQEAIREHGAPECIRSDNGPEFIAKAIQGWLAESGIKTLYIDPGCPWQNGYAESFNSRFREECLDRELIYTLSESRVIFADWKDYYNNHRPHRSLGLLTPSEFATKQNESACGSDRPSGDLRLRQLKPKPKNKKPVENLSFKPS